MAEGKRLPGRRGSEETRRRRVLFITLNFVSSFPRNCCTRQLCAWLPVCALGWGRGSRQHLLPVENNSTVENSNCRVTDYFMSISNKTPEKVAKRIWKVARSSSLPSWQHCVGSVGWQGTALFSLVCVSSQHSSSYCEKIKINKTNKN